MKKLGLFLAAIGLLAATPSPAAQEAWYRSYHFALRAIERSDWPEALRRLEESVAQRDEPSRNARTTRTRFVRYFPYYHLGLVRYSMGDSEGALEYFRRSREYGEILRTDDYGPRLATFIAAAEGPVAPAEALAAADEARRRGLSERMAGGIAHFEAGRFSEAVAAFSAVLAVDSSFPDAQSYLERAKRGALSQELAQLSGERPELQSAVAQAGVAAGVQVNAPSDVRPTRPAPPEPAEEVESDASQASSLETVAWTIFGEGRALAASGSLDEAAAKFTAVISMMDALGTGTALQQDAQEHLDAVRAEMQRVAQVSQEEEIARLRAQLEALTRAKPQIALISPAVSDEPFEDPILKVQGVILDDGGITDVAVEVNGQVWGEPTFGRSGTRNIQVGRRPSENQTLGTRVNFHQDITLEDGDNDVVVRARNVAGLTAEEHFTLKREAPARDVFAAVIGVSQYQNPAIPDLDFAATDAEAFHDYLVDGMGVPRDNIFMLIDEQATRQRMLEVLGEDLRARADPEDMVIIYYAGHGAPEPDSGDPDGDGAEKYLIPSDANPERLFSTGFAMSQVSQIFGRLRAQTILFIADACYSGAAGSDGRTFGAAGGSRINDNYLNRLGGTGRLILTASSGNQVSHERSDIRAGVFTYHLIEGLQGPADADGDHAITVLEAYEYVRDQVAADTQNRQNPILKGDIGGRLLLRTLPN